MYDDPPLVGAPLQVGTLIFFLDKTSINVVKTFTGQNQNQNQNSLLVKRQNDNTSPGDWPRKISP